MSRPDPEPLERRRRRSVGFLEREGERWACFLVTFRDRNLQWHGYFSFRPRDGVSDDDEIRTADIFLEDSEAEIDRKARGMGRPLLSGLLASALHTRERDQEGSPRLSRWFRELLAGHSLELAGEWEAPEIDGPPDEVAASDASSVARLRSLYESYRIDQVSHFICLVEPDAFESAVDRILEGERIDFRTKDRVQFARMVVDHIEALLPLPDFETWARDFLGNSEAYRLYAHTLHREGRLP